MYFTVVSYLSLFYLLSLTHAREYPTTCVYDGVPEACRKTALRITFTSGSEPSLPARFTVRGVLNSTSNTDPALEEDVTTVEITEDTEISVWPGYYHVIFNGSYNLVLCQNLGSLFSLALWSSPNQDPAAHEFACTLRSTSPSISPTSGPVPTVQTSQITLDGDYNSIDNKTAFLEDCSAALTSTCVDVRSGSIIVDIEGSASDIASDQSDVAANGLTIGGQNYYVDDGSDDTARSSDGDSDNTAVLIVTILLPVFCILAVAFLYIQYSYKKYTKDEISKWTTGRVCEWLEEVELSQYTHNFSGKAIDGKMLLSLDENDLQRDLAVSDQLHRRKIVQFLQELQETEGEGNATHPTVIAIAQVQVNTPGYGDEIETIELMEKKTDSGPIDIIDVGNLAVGEGASDPERKQSEPKVDALSPFEDSDSENGRASGLYAKEGMEAKSTTHTNPILSPMSTRSHGRFSGTEGSPMSGADAKPKTKRIIESIIPKSDITPRESPDEKLDTPRIVPGEANPPASGDILPDLPASTALLLDFANSSNGLYQSEGPGLNETTAVSEVFTVKRSLPERIDNPMPVSNEKDECGGPDLLSDFEPRIIE